MKLFWCLVDNLNSNFISKNFPINVIPWQYEEGKFDKWRLLIVSNSREDTRKIINKLWVFNIIISIEEKDKKWLPPLKAYPLGLQRKKLTGMKQLLLEEV